MNYSEIKWFLAEDHRVCNSEVEITVYSLFQSNPVPLDSITILKKKNSMHLLSHHTAERRKLAIRNA